MKCECGGNFLLVGDSDAYCQSCGAHLDGSALQIVLEETKKAALDEEDTFSIDEKTGSEILKEQLAQYELTAKAKAGLAKTSDVTKKAAKNVAGASKEAAAALKTKKSKKIIKKTVIITAIVAVVVGAALIFAYALALIGPPRHTIEFMLNDGTTGKHIEDVTFRGEGTVNAPNDPWREGYTFLFWATSPTAGRRVNLPTSFDESMTLYARWIAEHSIVIHLNDGTNVLLDEFIVLDGESIASIAPPYREGYAFVHWTTDYTGNHPFEFYTSVTSSLNLYAQWIAEHRVTLLLNDGTNSVHDDIVVHSGETVSQPSTPLRQGYQFVNWTADSAGNTFFDFSIPITGDTTIYAQWIPLRNVTVNRNYAGASSVTPQQLTDGSTVSQVSVPNRSGFDFIHWTSDAAGVNVVTPETVITTNMTLYAQWQRTPAVFVEAVPPHETVRTRVVDSVVMAGNTYLNVLRYEPNFTATRSYGFTLHNLDAQYERISGYIGRVDGALLRDGTITFHGDGVRITSYEIGATDLPQWITVDVTGVRLLRIEVRVAPAAALGARVVYFALANAMIE